MGGDAQLRLPDPSSLLQDSAPPVFSPVREGTVVYPKSMDRRWVKSKNRSKNHCCA